MPPEARFPPPPPALWGLPRPCPAHWAPAIQPPRPPAGARLLHSVHGHVFYISMFSDHLPQFRLENSCEVRRGSNNAKLLGKVQGQKQAGHVSKTRDTCRPGSFLPGLREGGAWVRAGWCH